MGSTPTAYSAGSAQSHGYRALSTAHYRVLGETGEGGAGDTQIEDAPNITAAASGGGVRCRAMTDSARFLLGSVLFFFVIVLPVLGYLKLRRASNLRLVFSILAIWLAWNFVNAPIHEGAHFLAGRLVGMHARECRLLPPFWRGDFVHGYISWEEENMQRLPVSTAGPYIADCLIVLLAVWLFPRRRATPFFASLILSLTYLRSIYDVAVNYTADTVFGGKGDFDFLLRSYPRAAVHAGAVLAILLAGVGATRELRLTRRMRERAESRQAVPTPG